MNKNIFRTALLLVLFVLCIHIPCFSEGISNVIVTQNNNTGLWVNIMIAICILSVVFAVVAYIHSAIIKKQSGISAMTDAETGIGNMQFFKHHFKRNIKNESRTLYTLAYVVLDISYLRSYHDDSSFDEVLKYAASVLAQNTGSDEISARITENGFACAFKEKDDETLKNKLKNIMDTLNSFESIREKNSKLVFHCAAYRLSDDDKNCELLLFNLRKNCNKIFGTGKQIVYCDVHSMNRILEEKEVTESIVNGLNNSEFKMYLQFIVDNSSKNIVSAEALSRWHNPQKGIMGPGQYIENMEKTGLISKHDFYMFEHVCKQLEKWDGTKYGDISISCNFTRITLSEENFIERIKEICRNYNFDRSKLAIEITEDVMEKDKEAAKSNVRLCKELGFKVYLDDLGSGYTALANLCDYPIDIVKMDRDILLKVGSTNGKNLFDGIIALAHSLNIDVICEGVETEEQNNFVSSSDCDYIQGWYYSKPVNSDSAEEFINNYCK